MSDTVIDTGDIRINKIDLIPTSWCLHFNERVDNYK